MAKAVVINGSPRMDKGNTAMVLGPFIEGMAGAGLDVDLVHVERLDVKPCSCSMMYCWYRKPGECLLKDDMQALYAKLMEAETVVLATPVYIPLPGKMQDVINRLCPLIEPTLSWRAGRTRARMRDGVRTKRFALVATGGWWEKENLDTVVRIVEELARDASVDFAGAVLRPHAFVMTDGDGRLTGDGKSVLEAVRRAGYELGVSGIMAKETLDAVSRPLVPEEEFRNWYNDLVPKPGPA